MIFAKQSLKYVVSLSQFKVSEQVFSRSFLQGEDAVVTFSKYWYRCQNWGTLVLTAALIGRTSNEG